MCSVPCSDVTIRGFSQIYRERAARASLPLDMLGIALI
jgi:hypothetical protein